MVTCPVVIEKFLKFKPTQERLRVRLAAILSMQLSNLSVKFHLCPVPQIVRSDTRWNWRWRPFFSSQCFWRNEVKKTVAKANLLNGKYTGMLILVTAIIPSVIFDIGMCSRVYVCILREIEVSDQLFRAISFQMKIAAVYCPLHWHSFSECRSHFPFLCPYILLLLLFWRREFLFGRPSLGKNKTKQQ